MAKIKDPVTLSGGPLGGETIEGTGWPVNEVRQFENYLYRRLEDDGDDLTSDNAVYVGIAN